MIRTVLLCLAILGATVLAAAAQRDETVRVMLADRPQTVHIYKTTAAPRAVVLLSSGDLGWMGFVVDVAEFLQAQHVAVLGFNTRAYLSSFTGNKRTLDPMDIPGHYESLSREAQRIFGVSDAPVLVGISEGAGLSVVAAADTNRQALYRGVIGLGLPASIELGWNGWKDWTIWITKGEPKEPHLTITPHVSRVSPLPMIFIQSKRDEFIPTQETHGLFSAAQEPKRMYTIDAKNHRFSDRQPELRSSLLDALEWIDSTSR
jgi:type IV secretory pathway VirJ component